MLYPPDSHTAHAGTLSSSNTELKSYLDLHPLPGNTENTLNSTLAFPTQKEILQLKLSLQL